MNHNTAITFQAFIVLSFIGFLCWLFHSAWPLLLLLAATFRTIEEIEYKKWKKSNKSEGGQS